MVFVFVLGPDDGDGIYEERFHRASSDAAADASRRRRETTNGNNDPSPVNGRHGDKEWDGRSDYDDYYSGSRERVVKSSFKLPLWELSVQQFQKQMDANMNVHENASGISVDRAKRRRRSIEL